MSDQHRVSVVICAYTLERWSQLSAAVSSALTQSIRPHEVLLVIDHNDELLQRARQEFASITDIPLRVVPNTRKQGLSGARNVAVEQATGDILAFLDDDATAADDWLANLLPHYADPAVMGVGGSAVPRWESGQGRPATLPAPAGQAAGELDWIVGCSYVGMPTTAAPIRNLMGCNMSVRSEAFTVVGGFGESLGRIGRTPLGCEETELCIRVRQQRPGSEFVFEPRAQVSHFVSEDRRRWSYLVRRSYAEGLSKAAVARMVGSGDALSSERSYATAVLPRAIARGLRGGSAGLTSCAAILAMGSATALGLIRGRMSSTVPDSSGTSLGSIASDDPTTRQDY